MPHIKNSSRREALDGILTALKDFDRYYARKKDIDRYYEEATETVKNFLEAQEV